MGLQYIFTISASITYTSSRFNSCETSEVIVQSGKKILISVSCESIGNTILYTTRWEITWEVEFTWTSSSLLSSCNIFICAEIYIINTKLLTWQRDTAGREYTTSSLR